MPPKAKRELKPNLKALTKKLHEELLKNAPEAKSTFSEVAPAPGSTFSELIPKMARHYTLGKKIKKMEVERKDITAFLKPITAANGGHIEEGGYCGSTYPGTPKVDLKAAKKHMKPSVFKKLLPFIEDVPKLDLKAAEKKLDDDTLQELEQFIERPLSFTVKKG